MHQATVSSWFESSLVASTNANADSAISPLAMTDSPQTGSFPSAARSCLVSAGRPVATSAIDAQDYAVSSNQQGFDHAGRHYAGFASKCPIFVPPDDYFIRQPQLWTQCQCSHICYVCVYDNTSLCPRCDPVSTTKCDCEPGCCGVPQSGESDSCDEVSTVPRTTTGVSETDRNETVWQFNSVRVTEPTQEQRQTAQDKEWEILAAKYSSTTARSLADVTRHNIPIGQYAAQQSREDAESATQ